MKPGDRRGNGDDRMSLPARTPGSGKHDATRQQLDELDSFLQRMLSVPTASEANEPGTLQPTIRRWRPYVAPSPVERETLADAHDSTTDFPSVTERAPVSQFELPLPQASAADDSRDFETKFAANEMTPSMERISRVADRPRHRLAWPIVGINRAFDAPTYYCGPIGQWIRSEDGRTVIGWVGIGLLAVAVAWVVLDALSWM